VVEPFDFLQGLNSGFVGLGLSKVFVELKKGPLVQRF